ncbi:MAG: hypothetical protein ACI8VC_000626 [Candidatus Endobugula sp.]|jgi:hypothetical protein
MGRHSSAPEFSCSLRNPNCFKRHENILAINEELIALFPPCWHPDSIGVLFFWLVLRNASSLCIIDSSNLLK